MTNEPKCNSFIGVLDAFLISPWQSQVQRKSRKIDAETSVQIGGESMDSDNGEMVETRLEDGSKVEEMSADPIPAAADDVQMGPEVHDESEVLVVDYGSIPEEPTGNYIYYSILLPILSFSFICF